MKANVAPDYIKKRVLILGCGNTLFGDDGFGPATAAYIQKNCKIPNDVHIMDVGTGASKILLIISLSEAKPEKLILLDAVNVGRKPGEIFEALIEDLLKNRVDDFSSHLFPTVRLLQELQSKGVNITILACQVENIPEVVCSGLSESVRKAVPEAAKIALELAERKGENQTLKRPLLQVKFEEMKNKTFQVVQVVRKLCEFCDKPLRTEERVTKTINISDLNDYNNLFVRARAHDRVEVNIESDKIYFYDHDYPGDAHPECVDEYSSKQ